jgi:hypothetical protein
MHAESAVARIESFIAALEKEPPGRCALLREHLDAAKFYALGAMPDEYRLNLKLANQSLDCVGEEKLRKELSEFVDRELANGRVE